MVECRECGAKNVVQYYCETCGNYACFECSGDVIPHCSGCTCSMDRLEDDE